MTKTSHPLGKDKDSEEEAGMDRDNTPGRAGENTSTRTKDRRDDIGKILREAKENLKAKIHAQKGAQAAFTNLEKAQRETRTIKKREDETNAMKEIQERTSAVERSNEARALATITEEIRWVATTLIEKNSKGGRGGGSKNRS